MKTPRTAIKSGIHEDIWSPIKSGIHEEHWTAIKSGIDEDPCAAIKSEESMKTTGLP